MTERSYWHESTVFFRLSDADLASALRGWVKPPPLLREPELRHGINPFNRQPLQFWSRVPDQPIAAPDAVLHPSLHAYPWISAEGLDWDHFSALTTILLRCSPAAADDHWGRCLAGPESANDTLVPVSPEFVISVVALRESELRATSDAWLSLAEVEGITDGWSLRVLQRLVDFFSEDRTSSYYLWTSR